MTLSANSRDTRYANDRALKRLYTAEPVLVDVRPAIEALPGMTRETILVSGPPLPWSEYTGGQRRAILGGVVHEGLAADTDEAELLLSRGLVRVDGCHDFGCVGSVAGVTTASMPVLVVEDAESGHRGHCTLFEGETRGRLNYGVFDPSVDANLRYLAEVIRPLLASVVRASGGVALKPIMERALRQGDELHSRTAAGSLLFLRQIVPALLELASADARVLVAYLTAGDYFFLRPAMAASKSMADRMSGVRGSSVVTAMAFSCKEFGIRVAGLGNRWVRGPLPDVETSHFFPGFTRDDIEVMGGESVITEVCGLGAFAQANALSLQAYHGGSADSMIHRNLQMYEITAGEHPSFTLPVFGYRGSPAGIDVEKVVETGITPAMNVALAAKSGGQIGAGSFRAPLAPFIRAAELLAAAA